MPSMPEPVAGVSFVDSPSLVLPSPYPILISSGGTLGVILAGSTTVSPIGGGGLPSGTGLVKSTGGTGSIALAYTDYLPGGDWFATEAKAMMGAGLGLTTCVPVVPGVDPVGVAFNANIQDAGKEGGAIAGKNAAWNRLTQTTIWQNMKTSHFAFAYQFSGNTAGIYFGTIDPSGSFGVLVDTSASIAGHWGGLAIGTGGSTASVDLGATDSAVHTIRGYCDGTTLTWYLDTVSKGTILTSTANFPTQQGTLGFNGPTSTTQAIYRALYGYVGV